MCAICNDNGIYRIGQYKTAEGDDVVQQNICECKAGKKFRSDRDTKTKEAE